MYNLRSNLFKYCFDLIDTRFSRISKANIQTNKKLFYEESIEKHIRLLNINREVIDKLIKNSLIQHIAFSILLHADLHKRNIYVLDEDLTLVTGLIDWQSTNVESTFIYANETPDFIAHLDHVLLIDDDRETSTKKEEIVENKKYKNALFCNQIFDVCIKNFVLKLRAVKTLDDTLLKSFRYYHSFWRDSAVAVRQKLIEIFKNWKELGLTGSYPYLSTEEELIEHKKQYEDFETIQKLKL